MKLVLKNVLAVAALLSSLLVFAADVKPPYNRDEWEHWLDVDNDCQNTRAEVLISNSKGKIIYSTPSECIVYAGNWYDPYTNTVFMKASEVEIDHLVPLKEAHESGGWQWNAKQKAIYANDMENLIPVDKETNRDKGAKTPVNWRPPNTAYWCTYAKRWIYTKNKYKLLFALQEKQALLKMMEECNEYFE